MTRYRLTELVNEVTVDHGIHSLEDAKQYPQDPPSQPGRLPWKGNPDGTWGWGRYKITPVCSECEATMRSAGEYLVCEGCGASTSASAST